jgi:hypothetical protein
MFPNSGIIYVFSEMSFQPARGIKNLRLLFPCLFFDLFLSRNPPEKNCQKRRSAMNSKQRLMTTTGGNPFADNQNSVTAGSRGPLLLQDYQLIEKLAHQNRERIPERPVHAKTITRRTPA